VNSSAQRRLRVFAGPNGSGKSTLLHRLASSSIPLYQVINADDIQLHLNSTDGLNLGVYGLGASRDRFRAFVQGTTYALGAKQSADSIHFDGTVVRTTASNASYDAALVAAFIRAELISAGRSFSFESVFSHGSKLEELRRAAQKGFRIYLYFVAMDAPELCVARVRERVSLGGHDVPEKKIVKRYPAALGNLVPALSIAYRAYVFDNSGREAVLLAEKTPQGNLNLERSRLPVWFDEYVLQNL
jgi:predicted ABC-type ATPase